MKKAQKQTTPQSVHFLLLADNPTPFACLHRYHNVLASTKNAKMHTIDCETNTELHTHKSDMPFIVYKWYRDLGSTWNTTCFIDGEGDYYQCTTDKNNTLIFPEKTDLSLLYTYFSVRKIAYTVYKISNEEILSYERIRMSEPTLPLMLHASGETMGAVYTALHINKQGKPFLEAVNSTKTPLDTPITTEVKTFNHTAKSIFSNGQYIFTNLQIDPFDLTALQDQKAVFKWGKYKIKASELILSPCFSPEWDHYFIGINTPKVASALPRDFSETFKRIK